ncbi:MAG: rhomboid family intramembrane serine protease [Desulfobacterales bacterium]|nr:rhomboid family intramembrane serine protease [Desulfobacterales bacterium]
MPRSRLQTEIAATTPDRLRIELWSLVLSAVGIGHRVEQTPADWIIRVAAEDQERARAELAAFEQENANWPPVPPAPRQSAELFSSPPTILLLGALAVFFAITGSWSPNAPWFSRGAAIGKAILVNGEWWRLLTALTLHADPAHLMGNLIIGGFPVHYLCRVLGSGLGWMLLLLSGVLGNYLNIVLHGPSHNSVGFSTAVFGAIGLLVGYQAITKRTQALRAILAPLAAGVALLALLGSSGEHTDLGAHFFGLIVGMILGGLAWTIPARILERALFQNLLLAGTMFSVVLAWLAAWG